MNKTISTKKLVQNKADLICKLDDAHKLIEENDTWGEIQLIIPDDTLTKEEINFVEHNNIEELAHNFKQVIFDIAIRKGALNHEYAHIAVNKLKEAVFWAKELIENSDKV